MAREVILELHYNHFGNLSAIFVQTFPQKFCCFTLVHMTLRVIFGGITCSFLAGNEKVQFH